MLDKRSVLIVDDHPLLRAGMAHLLTKNNTYVCFEASTEEEAKSILATQRIDIAIVDIELEEGSGLNVIREIIRQSPSTKCLVNTSYVETLFMMRARRAGARGFVSKRAESEFFQAVETVANGGFHPPQFEALPTDDNELGRLSDRELIIFMKIGEGNSMQEIATALNVKKKTIEAFRDRIKLKLGLTSAPQLVRLATHYYLGSQENSA